MPRGVLVLGIGNVLCSDDAVGVRVAEALTESYRFPEAVRVQEMGTPVDLNPLLRGVTHLIVIDAIMADDHPGSIFRLRPEDIPYESPIKTSLHQVGLLEGLAMASLVGCRPETVIFGVRPENLGPGLDLSPAVQHAVPQVAAFVVEELERLGLGPLPA